MKKRAVPASNEHHPLPVILLSLGVLAAFVGGYIYLGKTTDSALADGYPFLYPRPYSDTHISESGVVSDPRFSNRGIALRERNTANIFGTLPTSAIRSKTSGDEEEHGTWLWTPLLDITPEYRDSIIKGAKAHDIRTIYLSIDSYLDIYTMEDGPEKARKKALFDRALNEFIIAAHKEGITVDAEAGWRNWAEPGHEYKAFAVLEYAVEYNQTHLDKLRGFQFDIEPYLLPEYQSDKRVVLRNLVSLVNAAVGRLEGSDLELSIAIPEFYDANSGETPRFFFGLRYAHTYDHLLTALDRRPNSRIIIMAYRSTAEGMNGSIAISADEIAVAEGHSTKVVIAQETADSLPPYITFHSTSRAYYEEQLGLIKKAFETKESYGGLAAHYVNTYLQLK